jgi:hypothetical protein
MIWEGGGKPSVVSRGPFYIELPLLNANPNAAKKVLRFFVRGSGNCIFGGPSRPDPAPGGPRPGPRSICTDLHPVKQIIRPLRGVFEHPLTVSYDWARIPFKELPFIRRWAIDGAARETHAYEYWTYKCFAIQLVLLSFGPGHANITYEVPTNFRHVETNPPTLRSDFVTLCWLPTGRP